MQGVLRPAVLEPRIGVRSNFEVPADPAYVNGSSGDKENTGTLRIPLRVPTAGSCWTVVRYLISISTESLITDAVVY